VVAVVVTLIAWWTGAIVGVVGLCIKYQYVVQTVEVVCLVVIIPSPLPLLPLTEVILPLQPVIMAASCIGHHLVPALRVDCKRCVGGEVFMTLEGK